MALPNAPTDQGPLVTAADARPSQYSNEPASASTRLTAFGEAFLGHNIDYTADRAIAVEDSAAVAARDFNPLNTVERDRGEIKSLKIEILIAAAVHQDKHV